MKKLIVTAIATAGLALGAGAVSVNSAHATTHSVPDSVKTVAKPVTVTLPYPSEDDASRSVAITKGWAYVTVKGVTVKIGPAGPKSYGDYYNHAWHLTVIPPAR
jgi:hypothetical protein